MFLQYILESVYEIGERNAEIKRKVEDLYSMINKIKNYQVYPVILAKITELLRKK